MDQLNATAAPQVQETPVLRRYYVLFVLILVTAIGFIDRQIMGVLVEPIRRDLGLSDTQLGSLSAAFALVYVVACFPVARLADRWSRVNVIAIGVSVWSLMTGACGLAGSVTQMALGRVGVAIGEAGGSPPAQALVGDLFPRHERGTAMSLLMLCSPLGVAGGLMIGGWAADNYGWRSAFFIVGALGVLLGPLVYFTFPKRRRVEPDARASAPSFWQSIRQLLAIRSLMLMLVGSGLLTLLSMGLTAWAAAFLSRSHGVSTGAAGAMLGSAFGIGSLLGHLAGGPLLDLLGRRDLRWHFWVAAGIGPVCGALVAIALLAPLTPAIWCLGIQAFVSGLFSGPMMAIIMNLAPVTARATASALLTLMVNLLGLGVGPQLIGLLSDTLRPGFGEQSLRMALLAATLVVIPASLCQIVASLTYRSDMEAADARNAAALRS